MSISGALRSRNWRVGRRVALITIVIVLAIRNYGGTLTSWLKSPDREHDVVLTQVEFRPDIGETKPAWIIGLKNQSTKYTYDEIELEATYKDETGKVLETDRMIIRQKLVPGKEQLTGSTDIKSRPGAVTATLRVLGARSVKP